MKRLFLDENIDPKLKAHLSAFEVSSVQEEGWSSVKNGELIKLIESNYNVLITHDRGLEFQQDWRTRKLSLIVLKTPSNRLSSYESSIAQLIQTIETLGQSQIVRFEP